VTNLADLTVGFGDGQALRTDGSTTSSPPSKQSSQQPSSACISPMSNKKQRGPLALQALSYSHHPLDLTFLDCRSNSS
jgi:hypothetical protein